MKNGFVLILMLSAVCAKAQEVDAYSPPKVLSFEAENWKKISLSDAQVAPDSLLYQLFPAPMPEDGLDAVDYKDPAYWTCTTCPEFSLYDANNSDDSIQSFLSFPFSINYTIEVGRLAYKSSDGNNRLVVSFSTSDHNDGSGRFASGVLSLAVLEEQNNAWKVLQFELAVNAQGQFTNADPVSQIDVSSAKDTFFVIFGGVANGVSVEDYYPLYANRYYISSDDLNEKICILNADCMVMDGKGTHWITKKKKTAQQGISRNELETIITYDPNMCWMLPMGLDQFRSDEKFNACSKICVYSTIRFENQQAKFTVSKVEGFKKGKRKAYFYSSLNK